MNAAGSTITSRPKRLTRAESKAITRGRLLDAAATVFARKGFAATSVEDVAEAAGYTIGALYSNFGGKEDLFLAVLDQHLAADAELVATILGEASSGEDLLRRLAAYFDAMYEAEQEWRLLANEFRLYVARNPRFQSRLADQKQAALRRLARQIEHWCKGSGVILPVPAEQVALVTSALADGLMLQKLVEPESVSGRTFSMALDWLFRGLDDSEAERDGAS